MIKYDPHNWIDHFFDLKGSLVREIIGRVFLFSAWSVGVVAFHHFVKPVGIPSTAHSLVGVALGLLLVFRTNASYDRFWEGRKLWGGIVNESRNLARLSESLLKDAPELRKALSTWIIIFPYAVMNNLRGKKGLGPKEDRVPLEKRASLLNAQHTPLAVARESSLILQDAKLKGFIEEYGQLALDQNIQLLVDYMGACERIHSTPLPFAYVVHLRRALVIYCFTLPFALVESFDWMTIVATFCIGYTFFGIEEIGVETEDPFGVDDNDLPLDSICANIQRNVEGLISASVIHSNDHGNATHE